MNNNSEARHLIDGVPVFCAFDEIVDINKLKENPKNPNNHPSVQIDLLAQIIKKTGWRAPITVSNVSGFIVKGHGRLQAAKAAGFKHCPVEYQNFIDEEEEMAALLADNKLAELAEIDVEKLTEIFKDYEFEDLSLTGYSQAEFDELVEVFEEAEFSGDPDEVPEEVETRCKLGDIWQLGNHRLMCGDSTSKADVEKLMDGAKADMVFTDPPYGINLDTDYSSISGGWSGQISYSKSKKYKKVAGDSEYYDITHLFRDFGYVEEIFLWGANYFADKLPELNKSSWIVWDKTGFHQQEVVGSEFELLWSKQKHKQIILSYKWAGVIGLSQQDLKRREHPTQKPLQVLTPIIEKYSKENDIVTDLFGGSGSTLIASEQLNRKCYMMELDEHYCDVIITRWETLTGKKAVLCT